MDFFTNTTDKLRLLKKAANATDYEVFSVEELELLTKLLNLEQMVSNFPESGLRKYRDELSGQPLVGVKEVFSLDDDDELSERFEFIPIEMASHADLYNGLIFHFINPAAKSLADLLFSMNMSSYQRMHLSECNAWGKLAGSLSDYRLWAKHLSIVNDPGEIFRGAMIVDEDALDTIIFGKFDIPDCYVIGNNDFSRKILEL